MRPTDEGSTEGADRRMRLWLAYFAWTTNPPPTREQFDGGTDKTSLLILAVESETDRQSRPTKPSEEATDEGDRRMQLWLVYFSMDNQPTRDQLEGGSDLSPIFAIENETGRRCGGGSGWYIFYDQSMREMLEGGTDRPLPHTCTPK